MAAENITEYQKLSREIQCYTTLLNKRSPSLRVKLPSGTTGSGMDLAFQVNPVTSAVRANPLACLSSAGSRYFAVMGRSRAGFAGIKEHSRELVRLQKTIDLLEFETVEEPGVIPRMLAAVETILDRITAVDQPKLESALDAANGNLHTSQMILSGISAIVNEIVDFGVHYKTLIRIGLVVAALGFVATLVLIPLLVLRIILFGIT